MKAEFPRFAVVGTGSGCGKTTVTCALLGALRLRGLRAVSFKSGPDYIDPMFHTRVLGVPSRNLDLFLLPDETVKTLFCKNAAGADLAVVEGAMGLYDGVEMGTDACSANALCAVLQTPQVLVVNAKGKGTSLLAELQGYLNFLPNRIAGVILNNCSEAMEPRYRAMIEARLPVRVLGCLPTMPAAALESRHLGLVTAAEVPGLAEKMALLARQANRSIRMDALLALARSAPPLETGAAAPHFADGMAFSARQTVCAPGDSASGDSAPGISASGNSSAQLVSAPAGTFPPDACAPGSFAPGDSASGDSAPEISASGNSSAQPVPAPPALAPAFPAAQNRPPVRIAIARDEAFCFYYEDALDLLRSLGALLVPFSPLRDAAPPQNVCGLILGGGYPEEHAETLSQNASMRAAVRAAAQSGMPVWAECGGFVYLGEALETAAARYPLCGAVPSVFRMTGRLQRFGYKQLRARADNLLLRCGETVPCHEFHYSDGSFCGTDLTVLKNGAEQGVCGVCTKTLFAAYPHIHLCSRPEMAAALVAACAAWGRSSAN